MKLTMFFSILLLSLISNHLINGANQLPNGALEYSIEVCDQSGSCQRETTGLVLDYTWRCQDPFSCNYMPAPDYYANFGVSIDNNVLTYDYQPATARLYMTRGDNSNQYRMFDLLNKELRFDVNLALWGCGFNAALYFVVMPEDGGKQSSNYAGALYGTGYCDAQAPQPPYQPSCVEMDVWESNSLANALTTHGCDAGGYCDPAGCGFNPYGRGDKNFYGRGSNYQVDTTQTFTVVTRFVTDDGTDNGNLKEVQRFYVQNGRVIPNPAFDGYSSVSDDFCRHFGLANIGGVSGSMTQGMKQRMTLVMSWWGEFEDTTMSWLDKEPAGPCPIYTEPNGKFSFSNIKIGPIGSTGPGL